MLSTVVRFCRGNVESASPGTPAHECPAGGAAAQPQDGLERLGRLDLLRRAVASPRRPDTPGHERAAALRDGLAALPQAPPLVCCSGPALQKLPPASKEAASNCVKGLRDAGDVVAIRQSWKGAAEANCALEVAMHETPLFHDV